MKPLSGQTGVTILEIAVGLTILGVMMSAAAPGFSNWISNSRILTLAESFQNGLQLARVEAVRRNTPVYFQITDSLADSCNAGTSGANWVVRTDDTDGGCATTATIIQSRPAAEGGTELAVTADCSTLGFDGLGQLIEREDCDVPEDGHFDFDINVPGGQCVANGGTQRCRRIRVALGGQIQICDPAVTAANDPRQC